MWPARFLLRFRPQPLNSTVSLQLNSDNRPELPVSIGLRIAQTLFILFAYPSILLRQAIGLLKPLERSIFNVLAEHLDPDASLILRSQLREVNYVQRITARRTECNFYRALPFHFDQRRRLLFPFSDAELLLCTLRFQTNRGTRQVVKVHVVSGKFFELEFGGDMRQHLSEVVESVLSFKQYVGTPG